MSKTKIRRAEDGSYHYFCPGCKAAHGFTDRWGITGEGDNLTLKSSLGTNMGRPDQCHAMMENGRLKFLNDCYHELKGQTVDIPEWPFTEEFHWWDYGNTPSETLVQLHWQNRSNLRETEFVAQCRFKDIDSFRTWVNELIKRRGNEMPEGWMPLVCTEGADCFVMAAQKCSATEQT